MILGIIIGLFIVGCVGVFIGGCVGVVVMAIMQMAREDDIEPKGENKDGNKGPDNN